MDYEQKKKFAYEVFKLLSEHRFSEIFNSSFNVTKIKLIKRYNEFFLHIFFDGSSQSNFRIKAYLGETAISDLPKIKSEGALLDSILWTNKEKLKLESRHGWYDSDWYFRLNWDNFQEQKLKKEENKN